MLRAGLQQGQVLLYNKAPYERGRQSPVKAEAVVCLQDFGFAWTGAKAKPPPAGSDLTFHHCAFKSCFCGGHLNHSAPDQGEMVKSF